MRKGSLKGKRLRQKAAATKRAEVSKTLLNRKRVEPRQLNIVLEDIQHLSTTTHQSSVLSNESQAALDTINEKKLTSIQTHVENSDSITRRSHRLSLETLKHLAHFPTLVQLHDQNSPEPQLLIQLKERPNTFPVSKEWLSKSLFLASQVSRDALDVVPSFIAATRIAQMRPQDAPVDLAALARPFIAGHPRLVLSRYGDVFFEGRDVTAWMRRFQPARLTSDLRNALGMNDQHEGTSEPQPPPFIYGMQALGRLPPSYGHVAHPGLNASLPPGAQWGTHQHQWGNPVRYKSNEFRWKAAQETAKPVYSSFDDPLWGSLGDERTFCVRERAPIRESETLPDIEQKENDSVLPSDPIPSLESVLEELDAAKPTTRVEQGVELTRLATGYKDDGLMPSDETWVQQH